MHKGGRGSGARASKINEVSTGVSARPAPDASIVTHDLGQVGDAVGGSAGSCASNKIDVSAYDGVSQSSSSMAAQQQTASGVREHGLSDSAGMVFGASAAMGLSSSSAGSCACVYG